MLKSRGRQPQDGPVAKTSVAIASGNEQASESQSSLRDLEEEEEHLETKLVRKVDLRLCTIAGILCSLNLLDSGIISSAAVTSMLSDLDLTGNRYSVAIFIFTVASVAFQLPATIIMRFVGPPIFFGTTTIMFGLVTLCTAYIKTWKEMIALRVLLGMSMAGIYPGLAYLISAWYTRKEQQLRFAFLQTGEVIVLATGGIVNFGLNQLDHRHGLRGWQWMYIVQGTITMALGLATYLWIPQFPEDSSQTIYFLNESEVQLALTRIDKDRSDAGKPEPFSLSAILVHFLDIKLYAFSVLFFLLNLVSTALSYFLPIILSDGMGFSANQAILLSAPPYYYAAVPALVSSYIGDKYCIRGPVIVFNAICLIAGFCMLGFPNQVAVRYIGTYLATGAYVSNWAAMNAYIANNIRGQWKRATISAAVSACNGLGGIAGSYIIVQREAPRYPTGVWVSIGSHLLIITLVTILSVFFWRANRKAKRTSHIIEGVEGFRYTY